MAAITWIAFFASANFVISVAKPLDVDKGVQNEIVDTTSNEKLGLVNYDNDDDIEKLKKEILTFK